MNIDQPVTSDPRKIYPGFDIYPATTMSTSAEHSKYFSKYVDMYLVGPKGPITFLDYHGAPIDFTEIDVDDKVVSLQAQEESADGDFNASNSAWGIAHLTPELVNNIGKPLPSEEDYFCVLPPEQAPGATAGARARLKDRKYLGLAVNKKTGAFVAYRSSTDGKVVDIVKLPRQLFSLFFDDKALRELVVSSENKRTAKFLLPYTEGGILVTMRIPYIPTSLERTIKRTTEQESSGVTDMLEKLEQGGDEDEEIVPPKKQKLELAPTPAKAEEAPKALPKVEEAPKVVEPPKADEAPKPKEPELARAVNSIKKLTTVSPVQAKEAEQSFAAGGKKRASAETDTLSGIQIRRTSLAIPIEARKFVSGDPLTYTVLLAHLRHLLKEHPRLLIDQPAFAGKTTVDAMWADPADKAMFWAWARMTLKFTPWLLGVGPEIELPETMPTLSWDDML